MEISNELLKVLVCPVTKGPLVYNKQNQELISELAGLAFPVRDGVPMLLVDEARKVNKNAFKPVPNKIDYIEKDKEASGSSRKTVNEVA